MSPLLGAREKAKTKKPRFRKCGFSWFAHTGLYISLVGGKGGGKNEKTTLCKTWFFRGLTIRASMSPLLGAREEAKTKKPRFRKCGFFVACPYGTLYPSCGEQGREKNEKTTLCKMWFFRGLPIWASMSPVLGAREEAKTKKTRFRKCGFFVVCPYGPLCHPCRGQGRSIYARQFYTKETFTSEIFLS